MLLATLVHHALAKTSIAALWLFQDSARLNLWEMVKNMGWPARAIGIILLAMSAWSVGVMMDRWLAFRLARRQSREFAPLVAGSLREGRLDEAIRVGERNKRSHLAKVVTAGLQEFRAHEQSEEIPGEKVE